MRSIFLMVLLCAFAKAETLHAQKVSAEKTEREFRIDASDVPKQAKELVATFTTHPTVKWLQEENKSGSSIEAKFKTQGTRYSVEFSKDGALEDIEVVVRFSSIPETIQEEIKKQLNDAFDYYKIEKVQQQYPANKLPKYPIPEDLKEIDPRYELVVKSRSKGKKAQRFEYLFDEKGNVLRTSQIVLRSDHILRF